MKTTYTLLCLLALLSSVIALDVISPPSLAGNNINSPGFLWGSQGFHLPNLTIVRVSGGGCSGLSPAEAARVAGNGVYVGFGFQGCSFESVGRNLQKYGAVAVIFVAVSGYANQDTTLTDGTDTSSLAIASVEIDFDLEASWTEYLKDENNVLIADVYATANPWFGPYDSPIFVTYGAIIGIICFFNTCLALIKAIFYIREKGFTLSTIILLLAFQMISNILRVAFLWGDPQATHIKFTWLTQRLLTSLHEPFSLIAECLVLLCWWDLLTKEVNNRKSSAFLVGKWPRILFGVLGVVLLGVEFGTAIPHGMYQSGIDASRGSIIVYAIIHLFCAIMYYILGKRLLAILMDNNSKPARQVARNAITAATFLILLILGFILMATPMFWNPWGFAILWLWTWLCISLSSFFQVASLTPPKWPGLDRLVFGRWMKPVSATESTTTGSKMNTMASTTQGSSGTSASSVSASVDDTSSSAV